MVGSPIQTTELAGTTAEHLPKIVQGVKKEYDMYQYLIERGIYRGPNPRKANVQAIKDYHLKGVDELKGRNFSASLTSSRLHDYF